jgi:hypothetical protein
MGKKIKLREAQRRAREHALAARLRAHSGAKGRPGFIESYADFAADFRDRIERYRGYALRAPETWRCNLRVRSPERRFLGLVRFTFARFPVPQHLENAWLKSEAELVDVRRDLAVRGESDEMFDPRHWYITLGRGDSLYRAAGHCFMSRLETHHFVNAPIAPTQRAFWYAFARAQTEDAGIALKVARSKLVGFSARSEFWQDVARFFARNPTGVTEMNDLIDFIDALLAHNANFSLAGRTVPALRERMHEWHRALRRSANGLSWSGSALPDVSYPGENGRIWRLRQLKTDFELVAEGERMHHCVASYRGQCVLGAVSIWSLSCEHPDGIVFPCLTVELYRGGAIYHEDTIYQCRGSYNRLPAKDEIVVLKRWAREFGLAFYACELEEVA